MKHVKAAWVVLLAYVVGGLALGLADAQLGLLAQRFGTRPGVATAVSVNLILPVLAVGLGVVHRRLGWAWLGAVGMSAAFVLGLAVVYPPGPRWDVAGLLRSI